MTAINGSLRTSGEKLGFIKKAVTCHASVFEGAIVYIDGGIVRNCLANDINTSKAMGVCIRKRSSTVCDVRITGITEEVFSGLLENQRYFLSDINPGQITTTPVTTIGHILVEIGTAWDDKTLMINFSKLVTRA